MIIRTKDLPELHHLERSQQQKISQRAVRKSRMHLLLPGLTVLFGLFLGSQIPFLQTSIWGFALWFASFAVIYAVLYVLLLNTLWRWTVQKEVAQHG